MLTQILSRCFQVAFVIIAHVRIAFIVCQVMIMPLSSGRVKNALYLKEDNESLNKT
jgi:hypothetical protein